MFAPDIASKSDHGTIKRTRGGLSLRPESFLARRIPSPLTKAVGQAAAQKAFAGTDNPQKKFFDTYPEQFFVLVKCRDEPHQLDLLARFKQEGLDCKAVLS